MKIFVFIKQVPKENSISFDEKGNLIRENIEFENNVYDEYAIENAVNLREKYGFKVIAVSMGPKSSEEFLRYAISKGIDEAYLIFDPKLKGSDAYITAMVLSQFIKKINIQKDYSLFFGLKSSDAETGIVTSQVSQHLQIPVITGITEIDFENDKFRVKKKIDNENLIFELPTNCAVSFDLTKIKKKTISIKNKLRAKNILIKTI